MANPFTVITAPGMGRTVIRYPGIALFSTLARTTSALCPDEPTGPVPQRMSFCDHAAPLAAASNDATARVAKTRLNM